MAGTEPPSLPRLSSLGWSIDDESDLRTAIYDIADGTTDSALTSSSFSDGQDGAQRPQSARRAASHSQTLQPSSQLRAPLREWSKPEIVQNRATSDSLPDRAVHEWPPHHSTSSRSRTSSSNGQAKYTTSSASIATSSIKAPRSSMPVHSFAVPSIDSGFIQQDAEYIMTSRRPAADSLSASMGTASWSETPPLNASKLVKKDEKLPISRSGSLFKLKRPFGRKKTGEASSTSGQPTQHEILPHKNRNDKRDRVRSNKRPQTAPGRSNTDPLKKFGDVDLGSGDGDNLEDLTLCSSFRSNNSSRGGESSVSYTSGSRLSSDVDAKSAVNSLTRVRNFASSGGAGSSTRIDERTEGDIRKGEEDVRMVGGSESQVQWQQEQRAACETNDTHRRGSGSETVFDDQRSDGLKPSRSSDQSRRETKDMGEALRISNTPLTVSASTATSSSASPAGSLRKRQRDLKPATSAPKSPLPIPPLHAAAGDPAYEMDALLLVPRTPDAPTMSRADNSLSRLSSVDNGKSVRKTKSQSSMRLLRRPSFLSSIRQSSIGAASANAERKLSGESAKHTILWSERNRREMVGDSSPEMQRKSLPSSSIDDLRESVTSTPSLEEVRQALSPMLLNVPLPNDSISPGNSSRALPKNNSRPASPAEGRSRLDSSGGASGLFSSDGGSRQRATSLLPWRSRGNSQVSLTVSNQSHSPGPLTPSGDAASSAMTKAEKIDASAFDGNADAFLKHVLATVPRSDAPAILAESGDAMHKSALQLYMQQFLFAGHPLDVALRKLLMSLCLPKETQQIDRVMEAFAQRYNECNEKLFVSIDQPYVLAFSLMMLHTDTFNRNAKQKMTKADYVRNTSSSGVFPEILEYLYDNLTFTQFIYVEDDDFLKRRKAEGGGGDVTSAFRSAFSTSSSAFSSASGKNRVDPYHIIASGQTHTLRPDICIEEDSPYAFTGSVPGFDFENLLKSFVNAPSIEVVTARKPPTPSAHQAALGGYYSTLPSVSKEEEAIVTLRITKVGCISRKDDLAEDNKKAQSRKWKTCGMILTSSQLLFFRDLVWTSALDQRIVEQTREQPNVEGGVTITPRITYFKPDGVLALGDAVAVRDATYTKYKHVFRLVARQGDLNRQYLIQTASEEEMNDWIHKINLCAAFRSAGLRIRGLDVVQEGAEAIANGSSSPGSPVGQSGPFEQQQQSAYASVSSPSSSSNIPPASPSAASIASSVASTTTATSSGATRVDLLRRKLNARLREFTPIIGKVNASLHKHQEALDEKLRLARHLMIATPFTKTTRERLEALALPLASEILQLRLEVARYSCRKEMLILELEAGNRAVKASSPTIVHGERSTSQYASPVSLTPLGMSRSGSIGTSRASSISQSRAGSFSIGEAFEPVPRLPPASAGASGVAASEEPGRDVFMIANTKAGYSPSTKAAISDADAATPTLGRVALPGSIEEDGDRHTHSQQQMPPDLTLTSIELSANGRGSSDSIIHTLPSSSPSRTAKSRFGNSHASSSSPSSSSSSRFHHFVTASSPTRQPPATRDEPVERWDRTKMGRDADKRVSLVDLPDPQQWQTLTPKLVMRAAARQMAGPHDADSTP